MTRQRNSARAQRICFDHWKRSDHIGRIYMDCQCGRNSKPNCGQRIDPVRDKWRADHGIIPWAEGGEDTPENLFPVLKACDAGEDGKAAEDASRIAKNKRVAERHFGIKRSSGWGGKFKKKLNGEVVER